MTRQQNALFFFLFVFFFGVPQIVVAKIPIKIGVYYTWETRSAAKDIATIYEAIQGGSELTSTNIKIVVMKRLPFEPPLKAGLNEMGVDVDKLFNELLIHKLNTPQCVYVFVITSRRLITMTAKLPGINIVTGAEGATYMGGESSLIHFNRDPNILMTSILHELGHMLELDHQTSEICKDHTYVMCENIPNATEVEKEYDDTLKKFGYN